jgi:hypothetical protein
MHRQVRAGLDFPLFFFIFVVGLNRLSVRIGRNRRHQRRRVLGLFAALATRPLQLFEFLDAFLVLALAVAFLDLYSHLFPHFVGIEFAGAEFGVELALEAGLFEVRGHDLQGVEHVSGGLAGERAVGDSLHDLHQGVMDAVRIVDEGEIDDWLGCVLGDLAAREVALGLTVEETPVPAAKGRSTTLNAVGLDVSTASNILV